MVKSIQPAVRSVWTACFIILIAYILIVDWGSESIWKTLIYDRSGVVHEVFYIVTLWAVGLLFSVLYELGYATLSTKDRRG